VPFLNAYELRSLPGGVVREANITHKAARDEILKRPGGFFERGVRVKSVDGKQIYVIRSETLQTLLGRVKDVPRRTARLRDRRARAEADFRGENYVFAARAQRFTEHDLRLTTCVAVSRIKEIDARVHASRDQSIRVFLPGFPHCTHLALVMTKRHDTEGEP
jgi:hypothetical protein